MELGHHIGAYSKIIRLMTLPSTKSEYTVINEGCTLALHAEYMATKTEIKSEGKIVIYQDNTLTIWLTANEGNFINNGHVKIRRNFVKRQVIKGTVVYVTRDMVANIGTKFCHNIVE